MQDRPTAQELLGTIAELLERDVLEATQGPLRHRVRVAANLCRILEREVELAPQQEAREIELLSQVLGTAAAGRGARELSQELVERLQAGDDSELERQSWSALVEIVRGKLAVDDRVGGSGEQ